MPSWRGGEAQPPPASSVGGSGLGAGWRGEAQPSPASHVGGNGPSAGQGGEPGSVRSPGGAGMQRTLWLLEGQSQQTARAEALQVQISQLELQLRAQLHAATRAEQQRCDAVGLHAAMTHDLSETQAERDALAALLSQSEARLKESEERLQQSEARGDEIARGQLERRLLALQLAAVEAGEAEHRERGDAAREDNAKLLSDLQVRD